MLTHGSQDFRQRRIGRQCLHARPRDHRVAHRLLAEVKQILDHQQLVERERPCRLTREQQHSQLLLGVRNFVMVRLQPQQFEDQITAGVHRQHRDVKHPKAPPHRQRDRERCLLGSANRQNFWGLFAQQNVQEGD